MSEPAPIQERRQYPRSRVLKGGRIVFGHAGSMSYMLRNVSVNGACLILDAATVLPASFELSLQDHEPARVCRVIWHRGNRLGVAF